MDEDSRLLTKLYMAYSPVFDYGSVAFIVLGPLRRAYLFCNRGQAA